MSDSTAFRNIEWGSGGTFTLYLEAEPHPLGNPSAILVKENGRDTMLWQANGEPVFNIGTSECNCCVGLYFRIDETRTSTFSLLPKCPWLTCFRLLHSPYQNPQRRFRSASRALEGRVSRDNGKRGGKPGLGVSLVQSKRLHSLHFNGPRRALIVTQTRKIDSGRLPCIPRRNPYRSSDYSISRRGTSAMARSSSGTL